MTQHPRISTDPAVKLGKPCIKGTRITVELILERLADGWSVAEFCASYPHIAPGDIEAALRFAAEHVSRPIIRAAE